MPRQRTPTRKLNLLGSFNKHPERARPDDVFTGAFPADPPERLSDEIKATWREVVAVSHHGVLQAADVFIVEVCAALLAEHRRVPFNMMSARLTQLRVSLGALGLTPADRSRLSVPKTARHAAYKPSSLLG